MASNKVIIKWLNSKWFGIEEAVPRSRVKTRGPLEIGTQVQVAYKSSQHKAEIVAIGEKKRMPDSEGEYDDDEDVPLCMLRKKMAAPPCSFTMPDTLRGIPSDSDGTSARTTTPVRDTPSDGTSARTTTPVGEIPFEGTSARTTTPVRDIPSDADDPDDVRDISLLSAAPEDSSLLLDFLVGDGDSSTVLNEILKQIHILSKRVNELTQEVARLHPELHRGGKKLSGEARNPHIVHLEDGTVLIGSSEHSLVMKADDFNDAFRRSSNAKDFVIKLIGKVFSTKELAGSNFHGGSVFNGQTWLEKECLRNKTDFCAIMAQASIEFPEEMKAESVRKQIKESVNGKCRKAAFLLKHQS